MRRLEEIDARKEKIEAYLRSFKEKWLRELIKEVNVVLRQEGKEIKASVCVLPMTKNQIEATFERYNKNYFIKPTEHKVIRCIEEILDSCMYLLRIDLNGESYGEMLGIEKTRYRKILKICEKYRKKYTDSDYEDEIRRLITDMGGLYKLDRLTDIKAAAEDVSKIETTRIGAIKMLRKYAKIGVKVSRGKIVEFDVSDISGKVHHRINFEYDVQIISKALADSGVRDRFFDGDNDEDGELVFTSGKVYDAVKTAITDRLGSCCSFKGWRGESSADTKIIEAIKPLYKYLKTIALGQFTPSKMIVDLLELDIDEQKISNRIDKR